MVICASFEGYLGGRNWGLSGRHLRSLVRHLRVIWGTFGVIWESLVIQVYAHGSAILVKNNAHKRN